MIWWIILGLLVWYGYKYLYRPHDAHNETRPTVRVLPDIPPVKIPDTTTLSPRDQVAGIVESLNWCNDFTRICWPHIGKIVESQLAPTIEPLINLYLPKPFSKFRFISADLGKTPLTVNRVTVHRRFHDSIALDVDVSFRGTPNVSMRCAPLSAVFGIKELRWSGRLSVLLRPLISTIPLVGALQAAMITHPDIDMDFTGIANLADFGPLEKIVRMVLRNVIASMLVLPNKFIYKLTDAVDYFNVYHPPMGVLVVLIERGCGFTKEKKMGVITATPDLYCKAAFGLQEMKTEVRMNNLNPEWNCSKAFILSDMEQPFELSCYDKDTITKDDLLGTITFTAKQLLDRRSPWAKLQERIDETLARDGQIYISAQFYTFQRFSGDVRGRCVVSVLIDRATNLPPRTKASACRVKIGGHTTKETPQILRPEEPIPGVDPVNPIWSFSFDVLCSDVSESDVTLSVVDQRKLIGRTTITASELQSAENHCRGGEFQIGDGATLRAKVILRGLEKESPPQED